MFKFINKYLFELLICRCWYIIFRVVVFNLVNVKGFLFFIGFEYNVLSFMYINVFGILCLEWYFFSSVFSFFNILDIILICIKFLGDWMYSFYFVIFDNLVFLLMDFKFECFFVLKLYIEGLYGYELDYFFRYFLFLFVFIYCFMLFIESFK